MTIMFNVNKIRVLCDIHNLTLKDLAGKIDLGATGIQGILKNQSTSIDTLLKICKVFEVPVGYFFEDDSENGKSQDVKDIQHEELLRDLEYKDKRIKELERQIDDKRQLIEFIRSHKMVDNPLYLRTLMDTLRHEGFSKVGRDIILRGISNMDWIERLIQERLITDVDVMKEFSKWKKEYGAKVSDLVIPSKVQPESKKKRV